MSSRSRGCAAGHRASGLASTLLIGLVSLLGCTAPVTFGRTGDTLPAGGTRLGGGVPAGISPTRATVRSSASGADELLIQEDDLPPGTYTHAFTHGANRVFSIPFSFELGAAHGLAERLEAGVFVGFTRVGAELRLGVLGGADAPLALALSVAAAKQLLLEPHGVEYRAGIDASVRAGLVRPLLNVYLGYTPSAIYVMLPKDPDADPDALRDVADYSRDELRLALPVGLAIWPGRDASRFAGNVTIAIIPEFVLATYGGRDNTPAYNSSLELAALDRSWSIFLVVRGELWIRPRS